MTAGIKITKKEIIQEIRKAWKNGEDITPGAVDKNKLKRYYKSNSTNNHFPSWQQAIERAGIPYASAIKRNKEIKKERKERQNEEKEKEFLKELIIAHNNGIDLSSSALQKDKKNNYLYYKGQSIYYKEHKALFWETALKKANLPLEEIIKQQKWTKEKIILILKNKAKAKEDLLISNIGSGLEKAIYRIFGNYEQALISAKINPKKAIINHIQTKEEILEEIISLHSQGIDINYTKLLHSNIKEYRNLVNKSIKRFKKSWKEIVEKAGIDYTPYIVKRRDRTKEVIIKEIKEIQAKGEQLNVSNIVNKYPSLISAATKKYSSWRQAIEACGMDYSKVKQQAEPLTENQIIDIIKEAHSLNYDLNVSAILKLRKDNPLKRAYNASLNNFGSWRNAIKYAGIDYEKIKKVKTHSLRNITNTILEAAKNGHTLKPSKITNPDLKNTYHAATRKKISWKKLIEKNNIQIDYKLRNCWKGEQSILEYLRQKYTYGIVTAPTSDRNFAAAARSYFPTIKEAVEKAGLIYSIKGKITEELIMNNHNMEILYKYNKGFLQKIVDETYYSTWDKLRRRIDKQDLENEAFTLFVDSLPKKPAKEDLREYSKPIIAEGLKNFIKINYNDILFSEEIFFDLFRSDKKILKQNTEDQYNQI